MNRGVLEMPLPRGRLPGLLGRDAQRGISLTYLWTVVIAVYLIAFVQNNANFVEAVSFIHTYILYFLTISL